ncbi:MAG: S9 family peptidase, partial [Bacteroidales bacterium]|nr:S9 family peptidase [Bacteroidales bacterium]
MKFLKTTLLIMGSMVILSACDTRYKIKEYPVAERDETVVDDYFGTKVADPYRWLENDTSAATLAWVEAERALTDEYLSHIPLRETLKNRLTEIADYEKYGVPSKRFGKYFFSKNDGLQNQSVYYIQEPDGEPEVLLDPNKLSDDGTVSLGGMSLSNDGKYLAYTIQRSGSDWVEIYVMDIATKELLPDHIEWAKFTGAEWYKDGFFYAAYDKPVEGKEFSNVNENHKIYYHKLGDLQDKDKLFYENPEQPRYFHGVSVTDDERYMFLYESGQGAGHTLWIRDMADPNGKFVQIAFDMDYNYSPIDIINGKMYVMTNYNAPKGQLCVVDLNDLNKAAVDNWEVLIPEANNVMVSAQMGAGKLIVTYDQDASNHAYVYELDGTLKHEIQFPTFGSTGIVSRYEEPEIFYAFTSFTFPTTIYRYDIEQNRSIVFRAPNVDFNPEDYVTEQIFYTSKDGTRVPMFLT